MNYPQYRKARRLTRECCNNVGGNCLLLDDGPYWEQMHYPETKRLLFTPLPAPMSI